MKNGLLTMLAFFAVTLSFAKTPEDFIKTTRELYKSKDFNSLYDLLDERSQGAIEMLLIMRSGFKQKEVGQDKSPPKEEKSFSDIYSTPKEAFIKYLDLMEEGEIEKYFPMHSDYWTREDPLETSIMWFHTEINKDQPEKQRIAIREIEDEYRVSLMPLFRE